MGLREASWAPVRARANAPGFTLIELMVVIVVIGVLAAISLPYFRVYMIKGNLSQAHPYLMQIASKERMYKARTGSYFISSTNSEQDLRDNLGVDLRDAGDFCFVVVCQAGCVNAAGAAATSGAYIAAAEAGDAAIEFEVWALLRRTTGGVTGAASCTVQTTPAKLPPSGWVQSSGLAAEGRVVVLRYPPPLDGIDGVGNYRGIRSDWGAGITLSDALRE